MHFSIIRDSLVKTMLFGDVMKSKVSLAVILLGLFGLVAVSLPGQALAAPELRVGYVDLQKALTNSKLGSAAQKKYEEEVKAAQAKLDVKKKEFEGLQDAFQKQKESLNDKARAEKQEQLINREKDLKRTFQDSQEALRRRNNQLVGDLIKDIRKAVNEVGKAENFTLILEKSAQSVLYADNSIDVTDKVVKKFDAASN